MRWNNVRESSVDTVDINSEFFIVSYKENVIQPYRNNNALH